MSLAASLFVTFQPGVWFAECAPLLLRLVSIQILVDANAHPSPAGWALRARPGCVSGICGGWGRCRNAACCLPGEASRCNTHTRRDSVIALKVVFGACFVFLLPGVSAVLPVGATPPGSALLPGALPLCLLLVLQEACVATPGGASLPRSDCTTTITQHCTPGMK